MTPHTRQATPRSRAWAPEPRPSRWRDVLYGLAWLAVLLFAGIEDIQF